MTRSGHEDRRRHAIGSDGRRRYRPRPQRAKRRHLRRTAARHDGADPALVASILEKQPEEARASLYFVAFDVDADTFAGVKNAGALLLSAKSGAELAATFDELLSDRILVEAPRQTLEKPRTP